MQNQGSLPGRLALGLVLVIGVACAGAATAPAPAADSSGSPVVATIGSKKITLSELDKKGQATNFQAYQEMYDARKNALMGMIDEMLTADEAKSKNVTTDALLQQEVQSKVSQPTQDELAKFYEEKKAQMGGQTLEQIGPRIGQFLTQQRTAEAREAYLEGLRKKAGVNISLEPPRIDVEVAQNDPSLGQANAKVTLVAFSDFQCPYCSRAAPTLHQIHDAYGDKVHIVFRNYPLNFHPLAQPAAEAAECAHEQGKFWEYHDKLFANQAQLNADNFKKWAGEIGLDAAKFDECVSSGKHRQEILADMQAGQKVGVTGTPAFFVNGRMLSGAQPFEKFKEVIDDELR